MSILRPSRAAGDYQETFRRGLGALCGIVPVLHHSLLAAVRAGCLQRRSAQVRQLRVEDWLINRSGGQIWLLIGRPKEFQNNSGGWTAFVQPLVLGSPRES